MNLKRFVAECRQWLFPRQFRIELEGNDDWTEVLLELLQGGDGPPPPPDGAIDADFAMKLCNGFHSLKRTAARLEKEGGNEREVRNLRRVFERADPLLEAYGIRYVDRTGNTYDDGLKDFEPLGRPEEVEGLTVKKIDLCECPAVYLHGELIQRARGTVAVPPPKNK